MGVVWAATSLGLLTGVDLLVVPLVKEAGGGTDANASIEICSASIVVCNVSSWFFAVPAQSATTTAPTTTPRTLSCVTTLAHSSLDIHTGGCASEHENARPA